MNNLTNEELLHIHNFIHSNLESFLFRGRKYSIQLSKMDKLRFVIINNIKYIQQNPKNTSEHAIRAKKGEKITWGIRNGKWILIVNNKVEKI